MDTIVLRSVGIRALLCGALMAAVLMIGGCSGDGEDPAASSSSTERPSQGQTQQPQQQGQRGQMPEPGASQTLSSSDVSEEQLQTAARIVASIQMGTRKDRMEMQKDMREKYGNPQQMDSTQKAKARKEMQRRQMEMQKKQMSIMQEEAENEGMDPKTLRQIIRSARQDSTLQRRLQRAMKAQMKKQQPQMNQSPNQ